MCFQFGHLVRVQSPWQPDQVIRQSQRSDFPRCEVLLVAIFDNSRFIFNQPRLTGGGKPDIASVATVSDPRIADPRHFLDLLADDTALPEISIKLAKMTENVRRMHHGRGKTDGLTRQRRLDPGFS